MLDGSLRWLRFAWLLVLTAAVAVVGHRSLTPAVCAPREARVVRWRVGPECYAPIVLERADATSVRIPIGTENAVVVDGLHLHHLGIQEVPCPEGVASDGVGGVILDAANVLYLDGPIAFDGAACADGMCMRWEKPGAQVIYGWEKDGSTSARVGSDAGKETER